MFYLSYVEWINIYNLFLILSVEFRMKLFGEVCTVEKIFALNHKVPGLNHRCTEIWISCVTCFSAIECSAFHPSGVGKWVPATPVQGESKTLICLTLQEEAAWLTGQSLGIWMLKTRVQISDSDYWMNLSSMIPGANSPRFVNSQLVCLLPVLILNWGMGMTLKSPFIWELSLDIYIYL